MKWFPWFRRKQSGATALADRPQEEEFLWVEGRRHLKDLPYLMPIDQREIDRLDMQHYLIRYVMQCNYVAPVQNPKGILDVGCGTGRWAQEVATQFPQSKVFGLDLSAEQNKVTETFPSNYRFVKGNVLEELPFPDMTFDFVHQRFLHVAIPFQKWPHVIQELVRVTRVGGWIELAESDQIIHNGGPATQQLAQWALEWSRPRGIDPRISAQLGTLLDTAELQNIQNYRIDLPLGNWAGRIGTMTATDICAYNRAIRPKLTTDLGISPVEYDRASEAMQKEWNANHCFFSFYVLCGQRVI